MRGFSTGHGGHLDAGGQRWEAAIAPDADAVTIHGARTLVPLEQPEALAAQVRGFWERLP